MGNKSVVITGGSRGIGRACAVTFAKNGYNVLIGYNKNSMAAEETLAEIKKYGVKCVWWDNNGFSGNGENLGIFNRRELTFPFPELVDAMMNVIYPDGVPATE